VPAGPRLAPSHGGAIGAGAYSGVIHIHSPMIASDKTITSKSIVSHWGMRFARCWIIACASSTRILCRKSASCDLAHTLALSGRSPKGEAGPEAGPLPLRSHYKRNFDRHF
jgi:hypothetical protein